jgi:hypothetical protein
MQIVPSLFSASLNNFKTEAMIDNRTYTIHMPISQSDLKNFYVVVQGGLFNPGIGPYTYDSFNIEVTDEYGWGIDYVLSDSTKWVH